MRKKRCDHLLFKRVGLVPCIWLPTLGGGGLDEGVVCGERRARWALGDSLESPPVPNSPKTLGSALPFPSLFPPAESPSTMSPSKSPMMIAN